MRKVYSSMDPPQIDVDVDLGPSMTCQSFAAECDINTIMSRYAETNYINPDRSQPTRRPEYGDFSTVMEFQDAQNIIAESNDMFDSLPVSLRDRFNYDPVQLLAFLEDSSNREEAIKLGIVSAPRVEPVVDNSLDSVSKS